MSTTGIDRQAFVSTLSQSRAEIDLAHPSEQLRQTLRAEGVDLAKLKAVAGADGVVSGKEELDALAAIAVAPEAPRTDGGSLGRAERLFNALALEARPPAPVEGPSKAGLRTVISGARTLNLSKDNLQIARRLDRDKDGTIQPGEAKEAQRVGGLSRVRNESKDLSPDDLATLDQLFYPRAQPVSLMAPDGSGVADREGATSYDRVLEQLAEQTKDRPAPLGSVGQTRPGAIQNNDCGPSAALFVNDRRIQRATGEAPQRTHTEADAEIEKRSRIKGATDFELARLMDDGLNHAGGQIYRHQREHVTPETLGAEIGRGLESDPGGVIVPTIDTFNQADERGTKHWIVATKLIGDRLSYYEPGGPDGANHLREMSLRELGEHLPQEDLVNQNRVVYGSATPEWMASGEIPERGWIGAHERVGMDEDVRVESLHGVYGSESDARKVAEKVAADDDRDAVVTKERGGYAVYGIAEQKKLDRGLWSSNAIIDQDPRVLAVVRADGPAPSAGLLEAKPAK